MLLPLSFPFLLLARLLLLMLQRLRLLQLHLLLLLLFLLLLVFGQLLQESELVGLAPLPPPEGVAVAAGLFGHVRGLGGATTATALHHTLQPQLHTPVKKQGRGEGVRRDARGMGGGGRGGWNPLLPAARVFLVAPRLFGATVVAREGTTRGPGLVAGPLEALARSGGGGRGRGRSRSLAQPEGHSQGRQGRRGEREGRGGEWWVGVGHGLGHECQQLVHSVVQWQVEAQGRRLTRLHGRGGGKEQHRLGRRRLWGELRKIPRGEAAVHVFFVQRWGHTEETADSTSSSLRVKPAAGKKMTAFNAQSHPRSH
jgi:hypothetical protein